MADRPGLFRRLGNALRGMIGLGGGRNRPSEVEEGGVSVPPPPPPPPPPGGGGGILRPPIEIVEERDNVIYVPRHTSFTKSRKGKTYSLPITGRWTVGSGTFPPDASDVRDLYGSAGKTGFVSVTVGGVYYVEYPGQEGSEITYISYVFVASEFRDAMNSSENATATDVINDLVSPLGAWWEEVYELSILDN